MEHEGPIVPPIRKFAPRAGDEKVYGENWQTYAKLRAQIWPPPETLHPGPELRMFSARLPRVPSKFSNLESESRQTPPTLNPVHPGWSQNGFKTPQLGSKNLQLGVNRLRTSSLEPNCLRKPQTWRRHDFRETQLGATMSPM